MGLTTLYERRQRGDAIQYIKIEKGFNLVKYATPNRNAPALNLTGSALSIRGHSHRLERQAVKGCNQREFFFSNTTVPIWNSIRNSRHSTNSKVCTKLTKKKKVNQIER